MMWTNSTPSLNGVSTGSGSTTTPIGVPQRRRGRPPSVRGGRKTAKRQKLSDKERLLPEKLISYAPEGLIYQHLVDFEKRLDATLKRKRMDIQEAKQTNSTRCTRFLRMFIYNLYDNQTAFYHTDDRYQVNITDPPSWTLRIEGYLLEDDVPRYARASKKKFSRFFKRIFVQLEDKDYYKDNTIEWDRNQSSGDTDGFEIKRQGDRATKVKIFLHLNYSPSRYKLSEPLSRLLSIHTDTRPRVIMALWQYIKDHKLQDFREDRRQVLNDAALTEIFGCDKMDFAAIPNLVSEHLGPPDPIEIDYTIRTSGDYHDYRECYDIEVEVDEALPSIMSSGREREEELDEQIGNTVQQIREHAKKRDFMLRFAASPIPLMDQLIASQIHDYQLLRSSAPDRSGQTSTFEEDRRATFYYQPYVLKAVTRYLGEDGQEQSD